jgi:FAD binding domain
MFPLDLQQARTSAGRNVYRNVYSTHADRDVSWHGGVEALRAAVAGPVFTSADEGYDDARRVWNGAIDRRPAVIVECTSAADVATAVGFARAKGWEITVRGGAHSIPGLSASEGGLVISLRRLDAVVIDPVARRARFRAAHCWGPSTPSRSRTGSRCQWG